MQSSPPHPAILPALPPPPQIESSPEFVHLTASLTTPMITTAANSLAFLLAKMDGLEDTVRQHWPDKAEAGGEGVGRAGGSGYVGILGGGGGGLGGQGTYRGVQKRVTGFGVV